MGGAVYQNVERLYVVVRNAPTVHEGKTSHELELVELDVKCFHSHSSWIGTLLLVVVPDHAEQRVRHVLENQVQLITTWEGAVQLDNVGVAAELHENLNLCDVELFLLYPQLFSEPLNKLSFLAAPRNTTNNNSKLYSRTV